MIQQQHFGAPADGWTGVECKLRDTSDLTLGTVRSRAACHSSTETPDRENVGPPVCRSVDMAKPDSRRSVRVFHLDLDLVFLLSIVDHLTYMKCEVRKLIRNSGCYGIFLSLSSC